MADDCSISSFSRVSSVDSLVSDVTVSDLAAAMNESMNVKNENTDQKTSIELFDMKPGEYQFSIGEYGVFSLPNENAKTEIRGKKFQNEFEHTFLLVKNQDSTYSLVVNDIGNGLAMFIAAIDYNFTTVMDVRRSPHSKSVKFVLETRKSPVEENKTLVTMRPKGDQRVISVNNDYNNQQIFLKNLEANDKTMSSNVVFTPIKSGTTLGRFRFIIKTDRAYYFAGEGTSVKKEDATIFELFLNEEEGKPVTNSLREVSSSSSSGKFLAVNDKLGLSLFDPADFHHTLYSRRRFEFVQKTGLNKKHAFAMRSVYIGKFLIPVVDKFTADKIDQAANIILDPFEWQ